MLNTVWALTIVLAEVPSGALADILGRKKLIVATSILMVLEMCLLAFVPLGDSTLIFWAFLFNRILSGLAEAMASGADEAIAYDSLVQEGNPDDWPRVLSLQLRLRSIASVVTMTIGALIYDPKVINKLLSGLDMSYTVNQQTTMRFPIYLTLVLALFAAFTSLKMTELKTGQRITQATSRAALSKTFEAALWIGRSPFALAIILYGMCFDHILRMIGTMTSQYFRLIDLPEASFGVIGSTLGLLGLIVPKIAEKMVNTFSPRNNILWVTAISLLALIGLTQFWPYWGLIPMGMVFVAMMFVSFFSSHYLNLITDSKKRATVLSFKGLAFNLAYGSIGFFFALLIGSLRTTIENNQSNMTAAEIENSAFIQGVGWFPYYAIVFLIILFAFSIYSLRKTDIHRKIPRRDNQ